MADQCIAPHEVQEGDLVAYNDGAALPHVAEHVRRCSFCAAEVAALRETALLLTGALFRAACPEPDDLLLYGAGFMSRSEQRAMELHIKDCGDCQGELAAIARPVAAQPRPSPVERLREAGRQILRALAVPPPPQAAVAVRGAEQRRLDFAAGDYHIIVGLVPPLVASDSWQIEGQLSSRGTAAGVPLDGAVDLLQAEETVARDVVDEFGFFALEGVGEGTYTLRIEAGPETIQIEDLTIS